MKYTEQQLREAHTHSAHHRHEIEQSQQCGCFSCCKIYPASEVQHYIDKGETALCPHCGIDSVIGDASGIALTPDFLNTMCQRWIGD